MSGINERIRALCAAFDRTESPEILREIHELEFQKRKAEDAAERERVAAREAEKKQLATANNLDAWVAVIDQRIEQHFLSGSLGVGGALKDAIGDVLGQIRKQARDELRRAIEEQQRAFEAKLAEQKERLLAVPGKLPVAKVWCPESVTYQAEFVSYEGALWQACKDTAQVPGGSDWVCVARAGHDAVTPSVRGTYDVHKTYARLDVVEYDGSSFIARRNAPGVPGIPGNRLAARE